MSKWEKRLLGLFLLLIPTQLGRHFWPEWSKLMGVRVDYLSPTLYLIDLVWIGILGVNLKFLIQNLKFKNKSSFFWFLGLAVINVWVAKARWVAAYRWLRWGQLGWTLFYIRDKRKAVERMLVWVVPVWVIVETWLGLAQIVKGGSLGGWFYWLGERSFNYSTIGIAQFGMRGRSWLRAYGTFSHPNSLAGFLVVALVWWIKYKKIYKKNWKRLFWWTVIWTGVIGIMISGSRVVWGLGAGLLIQNLKFKIANFRKMAGMGLIVIGVLAMVMAGVNINYRLEDFWGGWDTASWEKRMRLNKVAVEMIKRKPVTGVGLGNFLVELAKEREYDWSVGLQPVHNIFLLMMSEIGCLGTGLAINWWWKLKKRTTKAEKFIWLVVMVTGMVDHYWLTLAQNNWILVVLTGLMLR